MIAGRKDVFLQRKSITVWHYIFQIVLIALFALICFNIFSSTRNQFSSFIWSSIAFLFITIFSSVVLLKNQKWLWFFIIAYLVKVLIGLTHYLYFIDPNYFQSSGAYSSMTFEYEGVFNYILTSAHNKIRHGILFYQYFEGDITHQEINSLISIPFIYFGDYVLTIAPINSFSSLLISMNIIFISKYKFRISNTELKYIAFISAYFPITLISTLLYRDIVGLSLMSIGLTLILFAKRSFTQYFMLIIACYLFYLVRTMYPVILLLAFGINAVVNQNYKSKRLDFFYKGGIIILCVISLPIVFNYANTEANESLASGALNFNLLILPLKLILGLIGPFPWTQFLLYETVPAYAYHLQDHLQGTFNIAFVTTIIIFRKRFLRKGGFNLLNITGILLIISGLFNSYMHMTYVAIGFIFLIPWCFTQITLGKFRRIYLYTFLAILILNIVVMAFFGSLGISSSWR
ncbi:MAG: hypothetical protein ACQEWG_14010 [Bacteroidota bacterium]